MEHKNALNDNSSLGGSLGGSFEESLKGSLEGSLGATFDNINNAEPSLESNKLIKNNKPLFKESFDNIADDVNKLHESLKNLKNDIKLLKKLKPTAVVNTESKKAKRKTRVPISIVKFLNLNEKIKLSRQTVIEYIYKYIQDNQLQGVEDTRTIYPNKELKELFNLNDYEQLSFYNIQTHIKKIYSNKMDKSKSLIIMSEDCDKNDYLLNSSDNISEISTHSNNNILNL